MRKRLLLSFLFSLLVSGYQVVFASSDKELAQNQNNSQEKQNSSEKSDVIDGDSSQLLSQPSTDAETTEQPKKIAPESVTPKTQISEPEPPAEDQSNSVSSFNFFYYLIEKIKFPDLLDESF